MSIPTVFCRSAYNYDTRAVSDESGLACEDESLAVQSSRDECDINTIVRRFGLTGVLPTGLVAPTYGDFTGVADYQSALAAIEAADDTFMQLPADLRARFHNNPQEFVVFCSDDRNRPEAETLGLVVPRTPPVIPPSSLVV